MSTIVSSNQSSVFVILPFSEDIALRTYKEMAEPQK